jgi:hypothetical protein
LLLIGLREGVGVGLDGLLVKEGLVEAGLLEGLVEVDLLEGVMEGVGLPVEGRLEGALEALASFFTA